MDEPVSRADEKKRTLLIVLVLVFLTFTTYSQVRYHQFIHFDDREYVLKNGNLAQGFSPAGMKWALTNTDVGHWHPLTWLSHMLDYRIFGFNAGGHHWTSLMIHLANVILLFFVLKGMTGALWRSAFVAALFAIHPLNVESVAWVAERKNVLSTFFWFSTMAAYLFYVRKPAIGRYIWVFAALTVGLTAKPMLVTLPFVLLLLDYWPLGRMRLLSTEGDGRGFYSDCPSCPSSCGKVSWKSLVFEKIPLLVPVALSMVLTLAAAKSVETLAPLELLPVYNRLTGVAVAYATYLDKLFWPHNLALFYPHPGLWPMPTVILSFLTLLVITIAVLRDFRRHPYLLVGWFWYLGTLVPVIGLVQVGSQAFADRYAYIPLIGLFIMMTWGGHDLFQGHRYGKRLLPALAAGILLVLLPIAWKQVAYWRNTDALFGHAIHVTRNNSLAHNNLGAALLEAGRNNEALDHFRAAIEIKRDYSQAHNNMGLALAREGRYPEAIESYRRALQFKPDDWLVHFNLAHILSTCGRHEEAFDHYREALKHAPREAALYNSLGNALSKRGNGEAALLYYRKGLQFQPGHAGIYNNMGMILVRLGRLEEAERSFRSALRLEPEYANAHFQLSLLLRRRGASGEADRHYEAAVRINPDFGRLPRLNRREEKG